MNGLGLAGLLILGIVGSTGMSYVQHRYYSRKVNELLGDNPRPDSTLVSGRHKGKLRGAVALLVVHGDVDPVIDRAVVMEGASVFARFREHPELCGPASALPGGPARARRGAVDDALARYRDIRGAARSPLSPPRAVP